MIDLKQNEVIDISDDEEVLSMENVKRTRLNQKRVFHENIVFQLIDESDED